MTNITLLFENETLMSIGTNSYYLDFVHKRFSIELSNQIVSGRFNNIAIDEKEKIFIYVSKDWYHEFTRSSLLETMWIDTDINGL